MIDWQAMTDGDLEQVRRDLDREQYRRRLLEEAPSQADALNAAVVAALGRQPGGEWVQPAGAHDAYRLGDTVTWAGTTWTALVDWCVWEPGVSGWREVPADPETPPAWVQPTGGHDAYQAGDLVTYAGHVWRSLIDGNVWSPTDYPAGWSQQ